MSDLRKLIKEGLTNRNVMQLATSVDGQPWLCTVHFFADEEFNLYWTSTTERRHSKDLVKNNKASAYVLVHENTPEEDWVCGISLEGSAQQVKGSENREACEGWVKKHTNDQSSLDGFLDDSKAIYKFTPRSIVMYNNKDFPEDSRQELKLS